MAKTLEKDLYKPVRRYLEAMGFTVRSEVNHCDIVAMRDRELWVVELKLRLNLEVILQAVDRQKMTPIVYVAIARPKRGTPHAARTRALLKRLGIGLLEVSVSTGKVVECVIARDVHDGTVPKRAPARRMRLEREFAARDGEFNCGGVTGVKLMTSHRQESLKIAYFLQEKCLSPKALRALGTHQKRTGTILENNVYGWFERIQRGVYALSPEGCDALVEYQEVLIQLFPPQEAADEES